MIFYYLVAIIIAIVLHEMAHAYVGYILGDDTAKLEGRLKLNPLAHIDPIMSIGLPMLMAMLRLPILGGAKPVPYNYNKVRWKEYGVALIALAGPLMNFVLAFVSYGLLSLLFKYNIQLIIVFLTIFIRVNISLMLFNLLPIPPLDGSRVLYSLVPIQVKIFLIKLEHYGFFVIYGLLLLAGSLFTSYINNLSELIINFFNIVFKF